MKAFNNSKLFRVLCKVCLTIFLTGSFALLTFSELKALYAPFEYAPMQWIGLVGQGVVLCTVHIFCSISITKALNERLDSVLFLIVSFLSINTAMWAVAREAAFTIAFGQKFLEVYFMLYLAAFIPTMLVFFFSFWKARNTYQDLRRVAICRILILILAILYFGGLQRFPLYQYVEGTHLWLIYYVYTINRIVLLCVLVGYLILKLKGNKDKGTADCYKTIPSPLKGDKGTVSVYPLQE